VLGESATNSGLVLTPLTISLVIGAAFSGFLIGRWGRYQLQVIISVIILAVGVFLLSRMTASTTFLQAASAMVIAGIGMGQFFPVQTLAAQNAVERQRIGVATGVITYLRALGQTLGVAIAGTVVNNTIASNLPALVPANTVQQLTPAGWQAATNTEILIDPAYRQTVVQTAQQYASKAAAAQAAAHIPPGAQHNLVAQQAGAQAAQQVLHLLDQVFAALQQSIVLAIQHGLLVVLIFCGCAFLAALFLKDIPLRKSWSEGKPKESAGNGPGEEDRVVSVH
jgi:MFS family permease